MFESNKLYNESGFKKEDDAKQFIQSLQTITATNPPIASAREEHLG